METECAGLEARSQACRAPWLPFGAPTTLSPDAPLVTGPRTLGYDMSHIASVKPTHTVPLACHKTSYVRTLSLSVMAVLNPLYILTRLAM